VESRIRFHSSVLRVYPGAQSPVTMTWYRLREA
jgi:hypothetical protein